MIMAVSLVSVAFIYPVNEFVKNISRVVFAIERGDASTAFNIID